jgi:hypothetical protein
MMFDDLTEDNFIMYAMKAYNSPHCIMSEFESDLKRTKYLKRLFRRYKITKLLKERLILNHIILLYNVFGADAATRILFFRIDENDYDILKTFLIYLNYMPDKIKGVNGKDIISSDILLDMNVAEILRKI